MKAAAEGANAPAPAAVRVAVLFAGRQASGGHNIIWGLHEYLKGTGSKVRGNEKGGGSGREAGRNVGGRGRGGEWDGEGGGKWRKREEGG